MSLPEIKDKLDSTPNTRNFISENVQNIQKLQDNIKITKEKASKKSYSKQQFYDKIEHLRSKLKYGSRFRKRKARNKKDDKNNASTNRSFSPALDENEDPKSFMETFREPTRYEKDRNSKRFDKLETSSEKRKAKVRDFGCQYGDPKGTLFFADGSNINICIPGRDKFLKGQDKLNEDGKSKSVVPSRYLLFRNNTFEAETKGHGDKKVDIGKSEGSKDQAGYKSIKRDYQFGHKSDRQFRYTNYKSY